MRTSNFALICTEMPTKSVLKAHVLYYHPKRKELVLIMDRMLLKIPREQFLLVHNGGL